MGKVYSTDFLFLSGADSMYWLMSAVNHLRKSSVSLTLNWKPLMKGQGT